MICDVVLVSVWPDGQFSVVCFECDDAIQVPAAERAARDFGHTDEAAGALCFVRKAEGGYVGTWGFSDRRREEKARKRAVGAHSAAFIGSASTMALRPASPPPI